MTWSPRTWRRFPCFLPAVTRRRWVLRTRPGQIKSGLGRRRSSSWRKSGNDSEHEWNFVFCFKCYWGKHWARREGSGLLISGPGCVCVCAETAPMTQTNLWTVDGPFKQFVSCLSVRLGTVVSARTEWYSVLTHSQCPRYNHYDFASTCMGHVTWSGSLPWMSIFSSKTWHCHALCMELLLKTKTMLHACKWHSWVVQFSYCSFLLSPHWFLARWPREGHCLLCV